MRSNSGRSSEETTGNGASDEDVHFDWVDILAFIIAAYQVIFPFLLGFVVIILLLYGVLYLWAL